MIRKKSIRYEEKREGIGEIDSIYKYIYMLNQIDMFLFHESTKLTSIFRKRTALFNFQQIMFRE